jgi:hypothetical protein
VSPYTILEKVFFWREIDYNEPIIEKWSNRIEPFSKGLQKFLDFVHPDINYVKLDKWDSWSMDHTLSRIIHPLLIQLKNTKHGSGFIGDDDVPDNLKSTNAKPLTEEEKYQGYVDNNFHARYEWVLDEMIWAFGELNKDNGEGQFFDHSGVDESKGFMDQFKDIKIDHVGLVAYNDRIDNGTRLFGIHFRTLWD